MSVAVMIAGPNGSGKSTLIATLKAAGIEFGEYLNADDIARDMSGDPVDIALAAQLEVRRRREAALHERRDHSFETVLSHPSHIDHLVLARDAGFDVIVYFVATEDPFINLGRVRNRVLHGGHNVPRERIATRYHRSLGNLPAALAVAHEGAVFDNSSAAAPMRQIATISAGVLNLMVDEAATPQWWRECLPRVRDALQGSDS
jgi:predicted ABC-type ATPase